MHRGLPAIALAALLALGGCARPSSAAIAACGAPTTLVPYPDRTTRYPDGKPWHGALVGPLFFSAFGEGVDRAEFSPGYAAPNRPTKVVIQPTRDLTTALTLEGRQCDTGAPLRFWVGRGAYPLPVPAPPDQFAGLGDRVATLEPPTYPSSGYNLPSAYGGYFLFTSPGKWQVLVRQGGKLIGSVVLLVPESAPATSG